MYYTKNHMIKKILIIEDDVILFQAYKEMFNPDSFNVINAITANQGLALIQSEKPDLIILDIMLPGGTNGFDILEKIEHNPETKKIPVIILTNLDSEEKVATTIGAKKYLIKANSTKDQIVNAVNECLR